MKRNAYFQLIHEKDGIYLQSFPAVDGGLPIQADDVMHYLDSKRFDYADSIAVKMFAEEAAAKEHARMKVSTDPNCLPENESITISLEKRAWMAKIRMYPPSDRGARLTLEDLHNLLEQHNVRYGILEKNLKLMWKAKLYCTDILIAKADLPVQGSHAKIEYHFDAEKTSTPTMLEDGSVDYHALDMIEHVKEGQLLATLIPEIEGTPGKTVSGVAIPPAKVSKKSLKYGKNIHMDEDGLHIYSEVDGDVTLVDDTVFVSNVYEVPADVGPSTGDITYEGSVEIKGNVLSGYKVVAAGNITVNGTVEGAVLESGGRIVLKNGVQGRGKAELTAEGDVITNFIESATVKAGGKVTTEAIMHSQVEAQDEVEVAGKRGMIAGGRVCSTKKISMKVAGSTMGTQTELEVGLDPVLIDRHQSIGKEIEKLSNERDGLLQNIAIMKKRLKAKGSLDEDKIKKLKETGDRINEIVESLETLKEEHENLEQEIQNSSGGGKIVVRDVAYPGVKLTISNVSTYLNTESKYCTFVREGADIRTRGLI